MMNYLGSVSAGEKYYYTLKSNGLVINPTNGQTLSAGRRPYQPGSDTVSAAIGAAFTDTGHRLEFLDPATALPSALGIDAKVPKAEQVEAEKFVEFVVLSTQGQQIMQSGDPER